MLWFARAVKLDSWKIVQKIDSAPSNCGSNLFLSKICSAFHQRIQLQQIKSSEKRATRSVYNENVPVQKHIVVENKTHKIFLYNRQLVSVVIDIRTSL